MGTFARRFELIGALLWLSVLGCADGSAHLEWRWKNAECNFQGDAAQFAIRDKASWRGEFDTNIFSLRGEPLADVGYVIDLSNRTRFPIEFDWRRSLLVDYAGWTHRIIYPREAFRSSIIEERVTPILVAPYGMRRIALWSPSLFESSSHIPFKPRTTESGAFRPKPSKEGATIEEGMFVVLRYQKRELCYRMRIELVARCGEVESESSANQVSEAALDGD